MIHLFDKPSWVPTVHQAWGSAGGPERPAFVGLTRHTFSDGPLCTGESIAYYFHVITAIAIWSRCFTNEETEARKELIMKSQEWIRAQGWLQMPQLFYFILPHYVWKPVSMLDSHWNPAWTGNVKPCACLSDWEGWKSPRRKLFFKALISGNILKLWGRVLMSTPFFLFVSFERTHVWLWMSGLWSLRNTRYP